MKDKLIELIREVSIADKTYPEYVEAVADKLIAAGVITTTRYWITPDGSLEMIPTAESVTELAREIFADLKSMWQEGRGFIRYQDLVRLERLYEEKYTEEK